MLKRIERLTFENAKGSYVEVDDKRSLDLRGIHQGRVFSIEVKRSSWKTHYLYVGAEILNGPGKGTILFGQFFEGSCEDQFLQPLGLDSHSLGKRLTESHVICKKVRITVEGEKLEGVGSRTEIHWTIREFSGLT